VFFRAKKVDGNWKLAAECASAAAQMNKWKEA
jgi:hypothetical protein